MQIKKAKRMIMLSKLNCRHIEQAFFILKDNEDESEYNSIVQEAYDIINQYKNNCDQCDGQDQKPFKNKFKRFFKALWF